MFPIAASPTISGLKILKRNPMYYKAKTFFNTIVSTYLIIYIILNGSVKYKFRNFKIVITHLIINLKL